MPNYRENSRQAQADSANRAKRQGINVDDIRLDSRSQSSMGAMISRFTNDSTPTPGHERQYDDDFVGQTFNGTNNEFTISKAVLGQNIRMWRIDQASGSLIRLAKTTNPAPGGNEFWFDDQFTVRVGTAPGLLDGLLAVYVTKL